MVYCCDVVCFVKLGSLFFYVLVNYSNIKKIVGTSEFQNYSFTDFCWKKISTSGPGKQLEGQHQSPGSSAGLFFCHGGSYEKKNKKTVQFI